MTFATRKPTRIPGYDYSANNYYFVTICTHEKAVLFTARGIQSPEGDIVERFLMEIPRHFSGVFLDKWVIMPNHIHAILIFENGTVDLPTVIGLYKSQVSREIHKTKPNIRVWQRSFHDHIIRDQKGYERIWNYIDENPLKWEEDCFYRKVKPPVGEA